MSRRRVLGAVAFAVAIAAIVAGCSPKTAVDFGPAGETSTPPNDKLSREVLREFEGREFMLGKNDRIAEVWLPRWAPGRKILIPFWLGVNPLFPTLLRPTLGRVYVMSESVLVQPLSNNRYLIRAGSKIFKEDTIFEARHTHYTGTGKMLPTVVRFVGTAIITAPKDTPASGTVTEKVPILREVSLPMHIDATPPGYARFETEKSAVAQHLADALSRESGRRSQDSSCSALPPSASDCTARFSSAPPSSRNSSQDSMCRSPRRR